MSKSWVPNVFTFINLGLGIFSIILCFDNKVIHSSLCILLAALIDRYDGRIARKLNAVSPLGKELDSLSDLVSFGVAPVLASWKFSMPGIEILSVILLLSFAICGAFRLARYNVSEFRNIYTGIPITAAGSLVALDNLISSAIGTHTLITVIILILLSYFMVSSIKIKKF